jgi:Ca-activated chloride channel family protein
VDYRYIAFDPKQAAVDRRMEELRKLFQELLLRTGGEVEDALKWLQQVATRYSLFDDELSFGDFVRAMQREETIRRVANGFEVTTKGAGMIRKDALREIFAGLGKDGAGDHRVVHSGAGTERLPETRAYQFGDPISSIDVGASLRNAMRRGGIDDLQMGEEDLEVHETEHLSSCATVLLVDISHSMILYGEDRITPAKKVAMALCELIKTQYPKDALFVVTFGDEANQVPLESLPFISVGPFHTNTRAALQMARELLRKSKRSNRQIIMITDGKPSALTERNGQVYKNSVGLDRRVVSKTLEEASACRRYGIPVTTFMLTEDPVLVDFVDEFTKANKGRAYYTSPTNLGSFLLVDFLRNRRRRVN